MNLQGRVAVVTGASAGIGEATARELSRAGAKLVLSSRREHLLETVARALPGPAHILACDIAEASSAERLLALAQQQFDRVDILINNASLLVMGDVDTIDLDSVSSMIRVNFEAIVRTSYLFGRVFKQQRSGAIINVSSIGARGSTGLNAVYGALKAGIERFTDGLRTELGKYGVKVGSIAPGSTKTKMLDELRAAFNMPSDGPAVAPEDIAAAVRFMIEQPDGANVADIRLYSIDSKM